MESYSDIRLKVRSIAERQSEMTEETQIMTARGQSHELTGMPRCAETLKEINEWNSIIRGIPVGGRLPDRVIRDTPQGFQHVSVESQYAASKKPEPRSKLPKAVEKEYRDNSLSWIDKPKKCREDKNESSEGWDSSRDQRPQAGVEKEAALLM